MIPWRRFLIYVLGFLGYLYGGIHTSGADIEEWRFREIIYQVETTKIISYEGQVEIQRVGSTEWRPAGIQNSLSAGDRIRTSKNSRATLRSAGQSDFNVEELTKLTVMATALEASDVIHVGDRSRAYVFSSRPRRLEMSPDRISAQSEKDPDPPPASSRWRIP